MMAAVFGMSAGILMGYVLALYLAENWLGNYSSLIAEQQDASSEEAIEVLAAIKESPHAYCSDAEIAFFRELVFRSIYLKDAGHIRGGVIDCSATAERPGRSIGQFKPEILQRDGTSAYSNLMPIRETGLKRAGLQLGNGYVVFGPQAPLALGPIPMRAIYTMNSTAGEGTKPQAAGSSPIQGLDLTTEGTFLVGDALYATRCSATFFKCVTTTATVKEAIHGEGNVVVLGTVLGGLAGTLLGIAISFLLGRSKSMEQQLRRAIANDNVDLAYQPIVNVDSYRIVGAEALARWTDEDGVVVGPDVFVRIAEAEGFIGSLTRQVVRRALRDFGETLRANPEFRLSVNVTAPDLADPKFLPMLDEAVERAKISHSSLVIEITESSTANRVEAMETIRELRRRGHSIHIDDFGTGYSSLSYLLYLNVDTIKIDKAFTKAIGTESVTVGILPQILAMAKALRMGVVAEGVETEQQANYFSGAGGHIDGQGWFYGRPVPAEEFHRLLEDGRGKARRGGVAEAPTLVEMPEPEHSRWRGIA
jgi:sensor c-di-GMP phosphodiesterase-like protein